VLTPRISRISTYTWQIDTILFALEAQVPVPTEGEAILQQQEVLDGVYDAAGLKSLRYP
jgi:hypothetical protein